MYQMTQYQARKEAKAEARQEAQRNQPDAPSVALRAEAWNQLTEAMNALANEDLHECLSRLDRATDKVERLINEQTNSQA